MKHYVGRESGNYTEKQLFSAKNYVCICTPLISPSLVKKLLVLLNHNGVKIRIITSDDDSKDKYGDRTPKLLKNAVKQEGRFFGKSKNPAKPPIEFKLVKREKISASLYVIDGIAAMSGSARLTEDSTWNNLEHLLIAENADETKMMENDFEALWSQFTKNEISYEHLLDGGLWSRIKDGIM